MTTPSVDPHLLILQSLGDAKEQIAASVFENYKLQVAQANEINNRSLQVSLHNARELADIKAAINKNTLEIALAAARTDAAIAAAALETQREIMRQGELTRNLINTLNTQNLNTALINTTTQALTKYR